MSSPKTHIYKVTMTCEGCSGAVERVLGKNKDVEKVEISLPDQEVKVTTILDHSVVLELIKKTGKETEYVKTA